MVLNYIIVVYGLSKEHLAAFQLSSVLIFLTSFTKVRESSNVNPNISRNIVTSRYGSTFSKSPALGSRARTCALHFSVVWQDHHVFTKPLPHLLVFLVEICMNCMSSSSTRFVSSFQLARAPLYFLRETSTWHLASCLWGRVVQSWVKKTQG